MSRRKILTVKGPRGKRTADLFLDPEKGLFFARIPGGEKVEHPHQKEAERLVAEELDRVAALAVWRPSIIVDSGGGFGSTQIGYGGGAMEHEYTVTLSLGFFRCELCDADKDQQNIRPFLGPDGLSDENRAWLERCYKGTELAQRKAETRAKRLAGRESGSDISTFHYASKPVVLPYTDATWEALLAIRSATGLLQRQVTAIMGSGRVDALQALAARLGADRQLPAGVEPAVEVGEEDDDED